jgi:hypothetical protein
MAASFTSAWQATHGANAAMLAASQQTMAQSQALSYLVDLVGLMVNVVIYCAVFRAVLHPDQGRFAYLRLGLSELFLGVIVLVGYFAFVIGLVIAIIPIGIVVGVLYATHLVAAAVVVGIIGGLAVLVAAVYLALRISLIGAMIVDDGRFHLGEAWTLTKGKTVSLFALGLVLFLILLAAEAVIGLVLAGIGFGALGAMAGGLQALPTFFQQPPQLLFARLAPLLAVLALVWIPLAGCAVAVMGAPWARVYLDLRPRRDIAETFA